LCQKAREKLRQLNARGRTKVFASRELFMEGLKVFFDLDQGMLVVGVYEREGELPPHFFFLTFLEFFPCPLDRVALGIEQSLNV